MSKRKMLKGYKNKEESDDYSYHLLTDILRHAMFSFLGFRVDQKARVFQRPPLLNYIYYVLHVCRAHA